MDITALTAAPLPVQIHAAFALPALIIGPIALMRRRRDLIHRITGRLWVGSMFGLAISSFWVQSIRLIGPFSPIHILSIVTIIGLIFGLRAALRRDIRAHSRAMRALYMQVLIGAGIFTFLPGRRMNALSGGDDPQQVFALAALVGAVIIAAVWFHPSARAKSRFAKIPLFNGRSAR